MNPNGQRVSHQQKILDFQQQEYVHNNFPTNAHPHKNRHNLDIVEIEQGKAKGTLRREAVCMICEEGGSEERELHSCDGRICGEMKNGKVITKSCNSKFHLDCIKEYNASGFDFAYAARVECQRKFLCPLHCCSVCNTEHKKQSAYESKLIECAYCFRAFHVDCCYPAGSEKLEVTIGAHTFKMLKCPSHATPAPVLKHIPACCSPVCEVEGELQECKKCVRSFHWECREVKQFDKKDAPEDTCDSCLRQDVILGFPVKIFDYPVIALHPDTMNFRMGVAQAAEQLGSMSIQWLKHGKPDGDSVVPSSHVAEVRENYLHLAEENQKSYWETTFDDYKEVHIQRYPMVFKEVAKLVNASRFAEGKKETMKQSRAENLCECGMSAHCDENNCANAIAGRECPQSCSRNKTLGFVCNNQKISTGFVNPNIEMKESGKKGYGIFATQDIAEGEFLAAFHGEICDEQEYERRRAVKINSRDQQCSDQFMELSNGFKMDMDREGSIARYVNHSCENFNAEFPMKHIRVVGKRDKRGYPYEPRRYLKATAAIKKGDEVTISYGFFSKENGCLCDSCKETEDESEWIDGDDDSMVENVDPAGGKKRKASSEPDDIPSAKAFKPSQ